MKPIFNTTSRSHCLKVMIHIIGCGIVIAFPFLIMSRSEFDFSFSSYLRHGSIVPFSFFVVFYSNYLYLIPKYLFDESFRKFFIYNLLLILLVLLGGHIVHDMLISIDSTGFKAMAHRPPLPPRWLFFMRDIFSMILTVGLSVAIRLSSHWRKIEEVRREVESTRTEAELAQLRNQLNPHFLLNTLNNIYALIAFDTEKAQNAVQELSRLLRHMLYDSQQTTVLLVDEIEFIRNYIELMRIRLSSNVSLETHFDVHSNSSTTIAPLLFISLIENAFKHGVSPTEPSYICIRFAETEHVVCCEIRNSNHPKSLADKSGSGIGLEQVVKRLELTYPNQYFWEKGVTADGREYYSILSININSATL